MAIYTYKARDLQGVDHNGTIETSDESQAAKILLRKNLVVTQIKPVVASGSSLFDKFFNKVSFSDLGAGSNLKSSNFESSPEGIIASLILHITFH